MPSRPSGSSHRGSSGGFRSSGSSFSSRSSSRPSPRPTTSHTSYYSAPKNNKTYYNYNTYIQPRRRYNQPIGYYPSWTWLFWPTRRPRTYYCRNHTYVFYPQSWTDNTGRTYESGYYDEEGRYYKDLALKNYDSLHEVICQCNDCGYVINRNLDEEDLTTCPKCSGNMEIITNVDEFIQEEENKNKSSFWKKVLIFFLGIILPIGLIATLYRAISVNYNTNNNNTGIVNVVNSSTITLKKESSNAYSISSSYKDKTIKYDSREQLYHDEESDMWLWYNQNYDVWQYWYEPISGNYGNYGWMEHDSDGWWIEASYNNWIKLPSNYDQSKLWYIVE